MKTLFGTLVFVLLSTALAFGQATAPNWAQGMVADVNDIDSSVTNRGTAIARIEADVDSVRLEQPGPVTAATRIIPDATSDTLFQIFGYGRIQAIRGVVTAAIDNFGFAIKLSYNADGTAIDLCAIDSIGNDGVGTLYYTTGTFANALGEIASTTDATAAIADMNTLVRPGYITITETTAGGSPSTARIQWSVTFEPESEGARVVEVP